LVGTIFADRYEILETLGEGGMGKVYKARHMLMRRLVAIKVVHPHLVSSAATLTRFQQEAEAVSRLNHPNIVAVHDFGLVPRAYLVMDYLDGISLDDLLEDYAPLSLDRSLHIFLQICDGLAHAHQNGVVHRDLKPSNIMLTNADGKTDIAKIVDFGIAKLMLREIGDSKHLTATGEVFGSPLYMSPEQCRAKSMDARSDIYSLGCIMYRTVTGHQPILGQELIECLYNHVNIAPRRFKDICAELNLPQALEAIVMKCMEKDQEKRFQSMLELKDALAVFDQERLPDAMHVSHMSTIAVYGENAANALQSSISDVEPIYDPTSTDSEIGRAATAAEANRAATAAEAGFAACAVENSLAASAAESGRAASAVENSLVASAAECERAASAAESALVISAAESARAASAAESSRAAGAAESSRAASAAESSRAASAHEAGLAAFALEAGHAASAAEAERAASATKPGCEASAAEVGLSVSAANLERSVSAAEASRAACAAESARAASAIEARLVASATEIALVASAHEAALAASAHEACLAASAHEARLAASAAEAVRAASAAEAGRAASAAESWRAASAAEVGRAASAAEAGRVASAAEAGRANSSAAEE
jgi:serine/threonine-protein kinase